MIPYGKQNIDNEDIKEVVKALRSNYLTQGPKVVEFEQQLAKYCGAKYAVACSNGTTALHLAYLAANLKKDDEVITTPNTFAATTNMVMALGAKPVFCDIRLDNFNIDESQIEKLITKRTKVIVPVHFSGQPCAMEEIKKIAKKHKLLVIEDACHALGAEYKGHKIGDCFFSDMALFSFHPVKSITTGEGGAILTNNIKMYKRMILLRNHGIFKDKKGKNVMVELGYNYRITDIQCALGISQLKKVDEFMDKRRQVISWYREELRDVKEIHVPIELSTNHSSWHILVVLTRKASDRDKLAVYLKEKGIGVNFHYPAVYSHPYYRKNGFSKTNLTNMELYHRSCITLPCFPGLKKNEVKYVVDSIRDFYKK